MTAEVQTVQFVPDDIGPNAPEGVTKPPEAENKGIDGDSSVGNNGSENRPDWLPTKFKTPEDMAKAYGELEKKLGTPKEETDPKETPNTDSPPKQEDQAGEVLESKGLSLTEFSTEWAEKGELSQDSYDKLAKAGLPKEYVDAYIEGHTLRAEKVKQEVLSVTGGQEGFDAMSSWAQENLPTKDLEAFNKVADSNDITQYKLALSGIYAQYAQSAGLGPSNVKGYASSGVSSGDRFESIGELTRAMQDPRYGKDEHFTKQIEAKALRSNI